MKSAFERAEDSALRLSTIPIGSPSSYRHLIERKRNNIGDESPPLSPSFNEETKRKNSHSFTTNIASFSNLSPMLKNSQSTARDKLLLDEQIELRHNDNNNNKLRKKFSFEFF